MKIGFFLIAYLTAGSALAQTYKSSAIVKGEIGDYQTVNGSAWLDYNQKDKYVELIFEDSIHHYTILKTGKPKNDKRFVVHFKGTQDSMLWNIESDGNYFFALIRKGEHYWFRELHNCEFSEIIAAKNALSFR